MAIFEQPLLILVVGLGLTAMLTSGWLKTGRGLLAVLALVALVGTAGMWYLERVIETDREQVAACLYQMARDAENNNLPALLAHVHPDADALRAEIDARLGDAVIEKVEIKRNLKVTAEPSYQPPRVLATFNVFVIGSQRGGVQGRGLFYIVTVFHKDGEQWKMYSAEVEDLRSGFQN